MAKTLQEGQRAIDRLIEALRAPTDLSEAYARATLENAASRAASKPTPQSRMAYEAMGVQGSDILALAGHPAAEVAAGSEWGSVIYTQFGPRNERGWWLQPSAEDQQTLSAGDDALDDLIQRAVQ